MYIFYLFLNFVFQFNFISINNSALCRHKDYGLAQYVLMNEIDNNNRCFVS